MEEDIIKDKEKLKFKYGGIIKKILENDTYIVEYNGHIQKKYASQLNAIPI